MVKNEMDIFKTNEIVWHTGFKIKVKFCHISPPIKKNDLWYIVQLPNGGFHETQMIEKYNNQDALFTTLKR